MKNRDLASSIDTYLSNYLAERAFCVSKSTLTSDKTRVKNIRARLLNKKIKDVTHSDIRQMILYMQREHYNNKTINEHLTILRAIFNRALLDGKIIINPTQNIINLKYSPKDPNPFSQQKIEKMQQEPTQSISEKNAVLFNVVSGLRIGELLAIAWEDVDWNNREIKIQRSIVLGEYKQTKTSGSTRIVELDEIAMRILKEQFEITGKAKSQTISVVNSDYTTHYYETVRFIFTSSKTRRGFKGSKEFNQTFFRHFLKKAEIKHRGADQLRHAFASHCLIAGINKSWIARQMGHESTGKMSCLF